MSIRYYILNRTHDQDEPGHILAKATDDFYHLVIPVYDEGAGIIEGPFEDCGCPSHHQHGQNGMAGCPVCNPPPRMN